jgi:hypothetical protein
MPKLPSAASLLKTVGYVPSAIAAPQPELPEGIVKVVVFPLRSVIVIGPVTQPGGNAVGVPVMLINAGYPT